MSILVFLNRTLVILDRIQKESVLSHLKKFSGTIYEMSYLNWCKGFTGLVWFNVGLEVLIGLMPTVWDSSLTLVRRHDITILIHHQGNGFSTSPLVPPRGVIWMKTYMELHSRRILHASGAISVHGGVSPGEPRTCVLWSAAECSADKYSAFSVSPCRWHWSCGLT